MVSRLGSRLDPVTRGWAVIFLGSTTRLVLGFVASVLIARELGPAVFGVYVILAAVSSLAGALADLGLSESAVQRIASLGTKDPAKARERGQTFFWLRLGAALLLLAGGGLLSGPLSMGIGIPHQEALLTLALVGVVATAMSGSVSTLLQAMGRFGSITLVMLTNAVLTVLLAGILIQGGELTIITALVVLGVGTSLASFVVGLRLLPPGWLPGLPSGRLFRSEARALLRFGLWLWVGGVLAMLATQIDLLLLNRWLDPATLGAYGLALNLASKVDVVQHSLYTALLPAASAARGEETVDSYVKRGLIRGALLAVALLPLFPLADPLILFFYGPAYAPAVLLFRLLLGVAIFDLLVSPLLLLAFTFNRPRLLAGADAVRVGTLTTLAIVLIPGYGPIGAVTARFVARFAGAVFTLALLSRSRRMEVPVSPAD